MESHTHPLTHQIVQFCIDSLSSAIHIGQYYASRIIDWILYPYAWFFLICGKFSEILWSVTIKITNEMYDLLNVIPLTIKVWFWSLECFLTYWCDIKDSEETYKTVNDKIYPYLETILYTLGLIPLPEEQRKALRYFWEIGLNVAFDTSRLPVPRFLICPPSPIENDVQTKPAADSEKNGLPLSLRPNENSSKNSPETSEPSLPSRMRKGNALNI